jgi:hypothetical protein
MFGTPTVDENYTVKVSIAGVKKKQAFLLGYRKEDVEIKNHSFIMQ